MTIRHRWTTAVFTTAALLALGAGIVVGPAVAGEEDERIVRTIQIKCDGSDCEEYEHVEELLGEHLGGLHSVWSSGDGPHRIRLRAHAGGGYLGVLLAELTPELRAHFGVAEDAGVMVSKVVDESPAARAGLQVGDIITAVDGESVGSAGHLAHSIRGQDDGAAVLLEVWRDGSVQNLTATIEERERTPHGMDYAFVLKCDDDEEDCSFARQHLHAGHGEWDVDYGCEGDGPCRVEIDCSEGGDCVCTVNGNETECSELPGFGG